MESIGYLYITCIGLPPNRWGGANHTTLLDLNIRPRRDAWIILRANTTRVRTLPKAAHSALFVYSIDSKVPDPLDPSCVHHGQ